MQHTGHSGHEEGVRAVSDNCSTDTPVHHTGDLMLHPDIMSTAHHTAREPSFPGMDQESREQSGENFRLCVKIECHESSSRRRKPDCLPSIGMGQPCPGYSTVTY
jgi:hypothetical protein